MAKDTTTPRAAQDPFTQAAAPLFTLGRSALDEANRQAERWLAHAATQNAEALRVAREVTAHALTATRALWDATEEATSRALAGAVRFATPAVDPAKA